MLGAKTVVAIQNTFCRCKVANCFFFTKQVFFWEIGAVTTLFIGSSNKLINMSSHFDLVELSDTIDGLTQDDINTEQNASCSGIWDESHLYSVSISKLPETSSEGSIDCSIVQELNINNAKNSEEEGNLNTNVVLRYISQMLLEEDTYEEKSTYAEELALLATEKAFHDILRQEYYSPDEPLLPASQISSVDDNNYENSNPGAERESAENVSGPVVSSHKQPVASDDPTWALPMESIIAQQIHKGAEEARKFIPNIGEFFINRESSFSISGKGCPSKSKKNLSYGDLDELVGRAPKQIEAYSDEPIRNETFDKALLHGGLNYIEDDPILCEVMQNKMRGKSRQTHARASYYAIKQDKDRTMEEPVDLRSLLIYCSQAVSTNDRSLANELMCKIRKYSSPNGDWLQRLAHFFVNGLEARLAGTGSEIYHEMLLRKPKIIDILKAYHAYLVYSPYKRVLIYFTNQTILNNISKHVRKVHIINFGILHGFQWPPFFEHFSNWESTPPKIRITMIEVPEPGFRPKKRVELIGKRLADYANSFNVPFEYEGIACKWEDVKVEDLKIENDEVVIVNCAIHSEKLSDEGTGSDSPRDIFLSTIRKIKPRVFIHGINNGSYNSPLFPHRFRSALLHYSSMFEMLDSNLPQDSPERLIIERDVLIPEATNVIACEGSERVKRPETYKQWHTRKLRAGLVPLSVDLMIKKKLKDFVRRYYRKEFAIDEDNGWLLVSWKGRILYGLTTWKSK
jgi:GRAS domain family